MNEFDFYKREQINERLWIVTESYGVNSTFRVAVITGKDMTVVIDTGLGAQSGLRRYIETYIAAPGKPMVAVLTHTHPDHVGGAPLFDEVHVNPKEFPELDWNRCHFRRFGDLEWFCGHDRWKNVPDHDVMNFCYLHFVRELLKEEDCVAAEDGDVLDFGDVKLEVIYCPSHSVGSNVYYWREENILFAGDAVQHWNGGKDQEFARESVKWLDRLISQMPDDVKVINYHDEGIYGMQFLRDARQCTYELAERIGTENDGPIGYTNLFHIKKPGGGSAEPVEMKDHYVNDVRLSYNACAFYK